MKQKTFIYSPGFGEPWLKCILFGNTISHCSKSEKEAQITNLSFITTAGGQFENRSLFSEAQLYEPLLNLAWRKIGI